MGRPARTVTLTPEPPTCEPDEAFDALAQVAVILLRADARRRARQQQAEQKENTGEPVAQKRTT